MLFFSPAMDNLRRGNTCDHCCCSASACRSSPAVMYRFDVSMFVHAEVGFLSQKILMWQCWRFGMIASKMIHLRSSPVSSRYEFLISPFLLFYDTKRLRTSTGNKIDHTIGGKWCVPLVNPPPELSSEAYVNPIYCGPPGKSSYMLVGCWEMSLSSVSKSYSMSARSEAGLMLMLQGIFCRAVLRGWNSHLLAVIPIALCCSCPTSFWNLFRNRELMSKAYLIVFFSFCTWHVGRCMQNAMPLNSHPKISFSMDHSTSPWTRFLIATESPPLWPDMWGERSHRRKSQWSIGRVVACMVLLVGLCLVFSLCVSLGYSLGYFLLFFFLLHWRCLLLFPVLNRSILEICSIPSEDCLAQRCLFCLYYFLG